jgi:hypothetical protein
MVEEVVQRQERTVVPDKNFGEQVADNTAVEEQMGNLRNTLAEAVR